LPTIRKDSRIIRRCLAGAGSYSNSGTGIQNTSKGEHLTYPSWLKFIGLLGILIEAKRKGFIAAVKPLLRDNR